MLGTNLTSCVTFRCLLSLQFLIPRVDHNRASLPGLRRQWKKM